MVTKLPTSSMFRSILPNRYHCTLKYCSAKTYTTGVNGIVGTTNTFQLNGLYDPDTTGVGHQPYGFDQLATFYKLYTVRNARVNIIVTASDDPANYLAWMVQPNSDSAVLAGSTLEVVSEYDVMNFMCLGQSTSGVPYQQVTLPNLSLPDLEGVTWPAYMGMEDFRALTTTNPANSTRFVVGLGNSAGNASKTATIIVEIFFDAYFENRVSLPQS